MRNIIFTKLAQVANASKQTSAIRSTIAFRSASFRSSAPLHDKVTVEVPTMGDSITEGTIVEWAAQVGQAVKVDDVIALVETDKVTIDIKAQIDGVITEHFAEVDDNVEVGANLYQIDTEAEATASGTSAPDASSVQIDTKSAEEPKEVTNVAATGEEAQSGVRVPSIHFLGKDGWKQRRSLPQVASSQVASSHPAKPHGSVLVDGAKLPPTYGRMPFSEREIEALEMGGASEAPYIY